MLNFCSFAVLFASIAVALADLPAENQPELAFEDPCTQVPLITRQQWRAYAPRGAYKNLAGPAKKVVVEAITTELQNAERLARRAGDVDIAYNFIVTGHNQVFEGRPWTAAFTNLPTKADGAIKVAVFNPNPDHQIVPRIWATVANVVACGVKHGAIATDYQLVVDKEECGSSLSARFARIIKETRAPEEPLPQFVC